MQIVRVLIVESTESDYVRTQALLGANRHMRFEPLWAATYHAGFDELQRNGCDVALIGYQLGSRTGLHLIREAVTQECGTPLILLTDAESSALHDEAHATGAADCLFKTELTEAALHRSIRYCLERRRAENALRTAELKFSSVTQSAHDGIIAADPQGRIISWNAGAHMIFGYREEDILGKPITTLIPGQWHAEYLDRIAPSATADEISPVLELQGVSQSGFEFPMELSVSGWRTAEGEFVSWIVRDATQRKAAENRLAEEQKLLRAVIDTIPDRIYVKNIDGQFVIDNEAHRRMVGARTLEDVVGKTLFDFFKPTVAARFDADDKNVIRSGRSLIDREEAGADETGEEVWMLTSKVPLQSSSGKLVGVLAISRDITSRKRAEEERDRSDHALRKALAELRKSHEELKATQLILLQTEKMESLGRLAAGVAHEVRNPLSQVMLAADFLKNSIPAEQETLHTVLDDIRHAVVRADKIVGEMLDFSAPKDLCLKMQDLNVAVQRSLILVKSELLAGHVQLEKELGEGLPLVDIDEQKIEQVFINLCTNAIHSMPKGGVFTVKTYARQLVVTDRDEGAKVTDRFRIGDTVVVAEFSDCGHGIPAAKLGLVFDPFFTTKASGKGTGLGLTVARKIIELHGGSLKLENRSEGGVKATVMLPSKPGDGATTPPS